uniref:Uncharacterized protein n=1 Tax=Opuntia streptacantha TaxID=393608 RepID=A0A7C9CSJ8_OPUST
MSASFEADKLSAFSCHILGCICDVPAKGVEDTNLKQKKNGTESTHGQTHGQAHNRAAGPEPGYKGKEREMEGKMAACLDRLSYDLDTEFTTKSRLRALKLT